MISLVCPTALAEEETAKAAMLRRKGFGKRRGGCLLDGHVLFLVLRRSNVCGDEQDGERADLHQEIEKEEKHGSMPMIHRMIHRMNE